MFRKINITTLHHIPAARNAKRKYCSFIAYFKGCRISKDEKENEGEKREGWNERVLIYPTQLRRVVHEFHKD